MYNNRTVSSTITPNKLPKHPLAQSQTNTTPNSRFANLLSSPSNTQQPQQNSKPPLFGSNTTYSSTNGRTSSNSSTGTYSASKPLVRNTTTSSNSSTVSTGSSNGYSNIRPLSSESRYTRGFQNSVQRSPVNSTDESVQANWSQSTESKSNDTATVQPIPISMKSKQQSKISDAWSHSPQLTAQTVVADAVPDTLNSWESLAHDYTDNTTNSVLSEPNTANSDVQPYSEVSTPLLSAQQQSSIDSVVNDKLVDNEHDDDDTEFLQHISRKQLDALNAQNEPVINSLYVLYDTPVESVELKPYVSITDINGTLCTLESLERTQNTIVKCEFLWQHSDRRLCNNTVINCNNAARLQCMMCIKLDCVEQTSYYCTATCMAQHNQLHKELHNRSKTQRGRTGNERSAAQHTLQWNDDDCDLTYDSTGLTQEQSATLLHCRYPAPCISTWTTIGTQRIYTPTKNDIGRIIRISCWPVYSLNGTDFKRGKQTTIETNAVLSIPAAAPPRHLSYNSTLHQRNPINPFRVVCLTGDHMVLTRAGWKAITQVTLSDVVMSFNTTTMAGEWKQVTAVTSHVIDELDQNDQLYRMQGGGMDVIATYNHRMLVLHLDRDHKLRTNRADGGVGYETVAELTTRTYTVAPTSKHTGFKHNAARGIPVTALNKRLSIKIIIPGMERVCDWWYQNDYQIKFIQFIGFWLGDCGFHRSYGHGTDTRTRYVCVQQTTQSGKDWLESVLNCVFPNWWFSNDRGKGRMSYLVRCPPLSKWLKPMIMGPAGYNPRDKQSVRMYPHHAVDNKLAEIEQQFHYNSVSDGSTIWSEDIMLAAMQGKENVTSTYIPNNSNSRISGTINSCAQQYNVASSGGYGNLLRHLQTCHSEEYTLIKKHKTVKVETTTVTSTVTADLQYWNDGIWHVIDGDWFYIKRWMNDEYVTNIFSEFSKQQAVALLDGFCRADGTFKTIQYNKNGEPTGQWQCTNSSYPMIDHLMLIAQLAEASVQMDLRKEANELCSTAMGRGIYNSVPHWGLLITFGTSAHVPIQYTRIAEPVNVAQTVNERGYYQYTDDNTVYCISVQDNANFLTRRVAIKRTRSGGTGVRSQPVFIGNCYNTLAPIYATTQIYPYTPIWALTWDYRKNLLLREILNYNADIICLQEVQTEHFNTFFQPQLSAVGYDGCFKAKTRDAPTWSIDTSTPGSTGTGSIDGCATFYRRDRFMLTEKHEIEFNEVVKRSGFTDKRVLRRLMKGNIALAIVLEELQEPTIVAGLQRRQKKRRLCVTNTHIYWDPEFADVKLWQTWALTTELEKIVLGRGLPLVLMGDYNSYPESSVYELLTSARVNVQGGDAQQAINNANITNSTNNYLPTDLRAVHHRLPLVSAYASCDSNGLEPAYTNFTGHFVGTLDYIFYTPQQLQLLTCLDVDDESIVSAQTALPNATHPSDHIALVADLDFKLQM